MWWFSLVNITLESSFTNLREHLWKDWICVCSLVCHLFTSTVPSTSLTLNVEVFAFKVYWLAFLFYFFLHWATPCLFKLFSSHDIHFQLILHGLVRNLEVMNEMLVTSGTAYGFQAQRKNVMLTLVSLFFTWSAGVPGLIPVFKKMVYE